MFLTKSNNFVRFVVFLCFSLTITLSSGANTISANQSLSGDETIISEREEFELGFFKAGNSSNYYIGIWYKKVTSNPPTIVWVANRETPITDRFRSELKIINGDLVLLNESKFQIWSTNTTTTNLNSVVAVILDDGNLVLRDRSDSGEHVYWQSFDHPTNTLLPGAKLGYDNKAKKSQTLTSWRSKEDPSIGLFSFEHHPSSKEYISKWNGSQQYWTTGPWTGTMFEFVPEMSRSYIFNFSYHTNENESYFIYSFYNPSVISRFVLDVSGQLQQHIWREATQEWVMFFSRPKEMCDIYGLCGAFGNCRPTEFPLCNCLSSFEPRSESEWNQSDFSGGCVRKNDFRCGRNIENPNFLMITVKNMPPNNRVAVGSDEDQCRTTCLNNCLCNAYSFSDNKCSVWDGDILNISEDNATGITIYVKVASKIRLPHFQKNNPVNMRVVVGTSVGVALFVLGVISVFVYRRRRIWVRKTTMEGTLMAFVYKDLKKATKNFSNKLGGGGFGSVFKGVLHDSSTVAVKKLESISQGEKQFRSEVSTIGTIQHVNLVRLRGFCAEGKNKLLVYDYMANGSLDTHLFRRNSKQVLNWKTRYQIAIGTARGLVYLHEKCRDCIIHCDIKPENILLDADLSPKIADFGLAKVVGRDFSRVVTTTRGSIGYLAPEWLSGVAITTKADVYSYGMMLFELVHGKRNATVSDDYSMSTFFPSLVVDVLMGRGDNDYDILSLLDIRLNREASVEEVTKVCKIACWCIQDEEESRPSMSLVEQILEGVSDVNMPPIPQSLSSTVDNSDRLVFYTYSSSNESSSQVETKSSRSKSSSSCS